MVYIGGLLWVDADEPDLERGINWKEINGKKPRDNGKEYKAKAGA